MKQNITIDDIARDLGVSKTTVSRAISGKGRIAPQTRQRVMDYIAEHHYRPSAAAKALAENRTCNLALVLPHSFMKLDLPFVRESMSAICEEASLLDYNILIAIASDDRPESLLRILDDRKADGVILSQTSENLTLARQLMARGTPFATMGILPPEAGSATVEADHDTVGGCAEFTRQWLIPSHGKAALLGGSMRYIVNQKRSEGFHAATAEYPREDIFHVSGLESPAQCAEAVERLTGLGVTQLLCMDDEICGWVLEQDLSPNIRIASLYDAQDLHSHAHPVSALRFDAAELGRAACQELLKVIQGLPHDPKPRLGYSFKL